MSASELHRLIIENSKPKYAAKCLRLIQSLCKRHEWPYMARRAFAYAIQKHMSTTDLQLRFDTRHELIQSLTDCLECGDMDVPCLEQCLYDIKHGRSTVSMHTLSYSERCQWHS